MFCGNCGKPGNAKFCTHCGAKLEADAALSPTRPDERVAGVEDSPVEGGHGLDGRGERAGAERGAGRAESGAGIGGGAVDSGSNLEYPYAEAGQAAGAGESTGRWDDEIRYEALMRSPAVRKAIERAAGTAERGQSGEEFLRSCDKLLSMGVPLAAMGAIAQPLGAMLGVGTGKERVEQIGVPAGRALLRVLCSLARHGQSLRGVRQGADGCVLEAVLPSDMWAFEGTLMVTVRRRGATTTEIAAATKIKGQIFDWGKSKRRLKALFEELGMDPA